MMKHRYALAPQMREYDKIDPKWIPYIMYFHAPSHTSKVLNTDSRGFRVSYKNGVRISEFNTSGNLPVGLIIGGSTAFGVGATNDSQTISSILSTLTDYNWYNFGGRAFNSTQELILFMLHHQKIQNLKKVIILSGINDLIIYYLSRTYSDDYGSLFFWSKYDQILNASPVPSLKRKMFKLVFSTIMGNSIDYERINRRDAWRLLFNHRSDIKIDSLTTEAERPVPIQNHGMEKESIFKVLNRDMTNWHLFANALNIDVHYVLQPLATWISKKYSREEEILFAELDNDPNNTWCKLSSNFNNELYLWFANGLRKLCEWHRLTFFDMNAGISDINDLDYKWLCLDRIHLNDEGNRVVADIIIREVL